MDGGNDFLRLFLPCVVSRVLVGPTARSSRLIIEGCYLKPPIMATAFAGRPCIWFAPAVSKTISTSAAWISLPRGEMFGPRKRPK